MINSLTDVLVALLVFSPLIVGIAAIVYEAYFNLKG